MGSGVISPLIWVVSIVSLLITHTEDSFGGCWRSAGLG